MAESACWRPFVVDIGLREGIPCTVTVVCK